MKVFIGGSNCIRSLPDEAVYAITDLIADGGEFLVGDSLGTDQGAQKLLAASPCENVTVYTSFAHARRNEGSWRERSCRPDDYDLPIGSNHLHWHQLQAVKDEAMAMDADSGLIVWDGRGRDALLDILMLACLGKPALVVSPTGAEEVASLAEVYDILPARNPRHCSGEGVPPARERDRIIDAFVPSQQMSGFLKTQQLPKSKLIDIILGSPVPLRDKYEACGRCAYLDDVMHEVVDVVADRLEECPGGDARKVAFVRGCWERVTATSFGTHRDALGKALKALDVSEGQLLYRKSVWGGRPGVDEARATGVAPFSSLESALEDLREEMGFEDWDDDSPCWSELERWHYSKTRGWFNDYTFYLIRDQIVFFDKNCYSSRYPHWRPARSIFPDDPRYCGDGAGHLSLPTPFGTGDVVTLDCRPFAPLCHGLILVSEHAADGTFPTVLVRQQGSSPELGDGNWSSWPLKGCGGLRVCAPGYSPLYHAETYEGALPTGEEILAEVGRWMDGDQGKAEGLDEALLDTGHGMSDEELRAYMREVG